MTPISVMIVDNDPRVRRIYQDSPSTAGFRVVTARNGEECLSQLDGAMPDVIVLGIMMPGKDGLQTCRAIRHKFGLAVPILFLTAAHNAKMGRACLDAGGSDYLVKRGSIADVIAKVNQLAHACASRTTPEKLTSKRATTEDDTVVHGRSAKALTRRRSQRTSSPRIQLPVERSAAALVTGPGPCSKTIEPRIPISSFGDGNASSRSSNHNAPLKGFLPPTPPSTIP